MVTCVMCRILATALLLAGGAMTSDSAEAYAASPVRIGVLQDMTGSLSDGVGLLVFQSDLDALGTEIAQRIRCTSAFYWNVDAESRA